jgi:Zn-dependent peptidase ImmA (M78 family)
MSQINPQILIWARETAGLSLDEACKKLGFNDTQKLSAEDKLKSYESGEIEPDQRLIEKMSMVYRRTPIIFYLDEPPKKGNRGSDFRSLPDTYSDKENYLVDAAVRKIKVSQEIIKDYIEDEEDIKPLAYVGSLNISNGVIESVAELAKILNFNLSDFRKKNTPEKAFDFLRNKVEGIGVFVLLIGDLGNYYSKLDLKAFRGFAISDKLVPYIAINDNDAKPAFSFTLIHELVHILLGQTGISGQFSDSKTERFCNDVASEFLLPTKDILTSFGQLSSQVDIRNVISKKASQWNLSHSLIAYKLYRNSIIDYSTWIDLSNSYASFWKLNNKPKSENPNPQGPNYFVVKKYKLGKNIVQSVKRFMDDGTMSITKAAKVLGVNARNVNSLFG